MFFLHPMDLSPFCLTCCSLWWGHGHILCNLPNSFCVMKKQNYCPSHWTWEFSRCLIIVWFGIFEFFSPLISLVKHVLLLGSPFDAHIVELVKGVWGKKKGKFKVVVFLEFFIFSLSQLSLRKRKGKGGKGKTRRWTLLRMRIVRVKLKNTET